MSDKKYENFESWKPTRESSSFLTSHNDNFIVFEMFC